MPIKNMLIVGVTTVVTVFFSTIAFNIAHNPGQYFSRIAKTSLIYKGASEQTEIMAYDYHLEMKKVGEVMKLEKERDQAEKDEFEKMLREMARVNRERAIERIDKLDLEKKDRNNQREDL